ncbi:MAG: transcriptional regulator NanR [Pelagimonas sp.]|uniref:transcriptional regulator NanR n=1 Tax=Pelagimonas sp. TaxID=2073170 RepID=UPI003D6BFC13
MKKSAPQEASIEVAPITRQKLSDQVYDRLWEMIVSGDLGPGDVIPSERVLMEKFSVGRPAVREALQALASKGVITISHGERSRVNELTATIALEQVDEIAKLLLSAEPSNLDHLKQIRKILEAGTVRVAAANRSDEDLRSLRALLDRQKRQLKNTKGFIEADIEFHAALANASGNPLLQAITRAMLTWLFEYYKPLLHWSGREGTTLQEHEKLIQHLEARDADGAAALMREHLDRSDPLYTSSNS